MFYPEITIAQLFEQFLSTLRWSWYTREKRASTERLNGTLSLQSGPVLIQYFNPQRPAKINLIDATEAELLTASTLSLVQSTLNGISAHGGIFICCHHDRENLDLFKHLCHEHGIPLLLSPVSSHNIFQLLTPYLICNLSERQVIHGTFIAIGNQGVLLTGDSGVGKSLTGLFCLERKHRLICDDAPHFYRIGNQIHGECPKELQGLLAVRSLGLLDIAQQFDPLACTATHQLDLIIHLLPEIKEAKEAQTKNISVDLHCLLGVEVKRINLAFSQNIAILIEHIVRNLLIRPT